METTETSVEVKKSLAEQWYETTPEYSARRYEFGTKNFSKMVLFLNAARPSLSELRVYMDMKPARDWENGETYEEYKMRQKFQNALIKYRTFVKSFTLVDSIKKIQEKKNELTKQEASTSEEGTAKEE